MKVIWKNNDFVLLLRFLLQSEQQLLSPSDTLLVSEGWMTSAHAREYQYVDVDPNLENIVSKYSNLLFVIIHRLLMD